MTTLPNSLKSDNLVYYTLVDNINYVLGYCIIQANSKFKIHYHDTDEMYVILDGEDEFYVILDGQDEFYNHTEWVKIKKENQLILNHIQIIVVKQILGLF